MIKMFILYVLIICCSCSNYIVVKREKISKDTSIEYRKLYELGNETLIINLSVNNKMRTRYFIEPVNLTYCKNYLIIKVDETNKKWIAILDTSQQRILFCSSIYRDLQIPFEIRKFTKEDTTLIKKFLNGYTPDAKEQVLFYLDKSIGFAKAND